MLFIFQDDQIMKLNPAQRVCETDYPTFRAFHAARRLAVGAAVAVVMAGCERTPRPSGEAPLADPPSTESTNSVSRLLGEVATAQAAEEFAEDGLRLSGLRAELPEIAVPTNSVKIPVETFGPEIMEAIAAGKSEEEIMEMIVAKKRSFMISVETEGEIPASVPPFIDSL
ncbi:MAG: hypothetical protein JXR40_09350 [Pontiellaceae bacterium]|nr:hypothetical protein [Pontiellaceae bacterium]